MKKLKKPLSLVLVFTMLVTTFLFANVFTVANAALAYDVPKQDFTNKTVTTGKTSLGTGYEGDYVEVKYPTTIYMDISENLDDTEATFEISGHFGNSQNYRVYVGSDTWGGNRYKASPKYNQHHTGTYTYDGVSYLNDAMDLNFDNYGAKSGTNGGSGSYYTESNWAVNGHDNYLYGCENPNNFLIRMTLTGKPKAVGEFRFTNEGSDVSFLTQTRPTQVAWDNWGSTKIVANYATPVKMTVIVYDKSSLNSICTTSNAITDGSIYTELSWTAFTNARTAANNILTTREVTNKQIVDAAKALTNAKSALTLKPVIDYSALNTAITKANSVKTSVDYKNNNYTDDTKLAFDNAYTAAMAALKATTQTEVDNAKNTLIATQAALVLKGADYSAVTTAITSANALNKDNYTNWSIVESAINAVKYGYDITRQSEVTAMATAITTAINQLNLKAANYTALQASIDRAPQYGESFYKVATWSAYQTALTNAKNVSKDLKITDQGIIDNLKAELDSAFTALAFRDADYTAVEAQIALIPSNLSIYTDKSVQAVTNAKNAVVRGYNILKQAEVNAMATAIENAIAGLELKPVVNYEALNTAIANADVVKTSSNYINNYYTAQTTLAFNNAYTAAKAALTATIQTEVDNAKNALVAAQTALTLKNADYSNVTSAINSANALSENDYTNWSIVDDAINAVEYGYDITRQADVNQMAADIYNAISKLERYIIIKVNYVGNGSIYYDDIQLQNGGIISTLKEDTVNLKAVAAENTKFLYWKDENNRIVSYKNDLTVRALYSTSYTAVFEDIAPESTYTVTFLGLNGAVIDVQTVNEGENAKAPTPRHYTGYSFAGWNGDFTAVTSNVTVVATYTVYEDGYSVTKAKNEINMTGKPLENGKYAHNTRVMFTLDDYSTFAGWSTDGVNVISYERQYILYIGTDVNITYITKNPNDPDPVPQPIVAITDVKVEENKDDTSRAFVTVMVERTAPSSEYSLVSAGIIFSTSGKDLTIENADANDDIFIRTTTSSVVNGQYRLTINVGKTDALSFRGYAVYKDKEGNLKTLYTNTTSVTPSEVL